MECAKQDRTRKKAEKDVALARVSLLPYPTRHFAAQIAPNFCLRQGTSPLNTHVIKLLTLPQKVGGGWGWVYNL